MVTLVVSELLVGCSRDSHGYTVVGPAGPLYVDDGGKGGLPVLFVHAFAGKGLHWKEQLQHLRGSRRALALDLRGHGASGSPSDNNYAVDALASDIAAVAVERGLKRFVLVGHSMGGAASIRYASTHPERVAGLVLVSTPGKTPSEMVTAVMGAMKADYVKATQGYWDKLLKNAQPEVNSLIREGISRVPQAASVAMIESIFAYDPFSDLAAYKGPKLIVDTDAPDAAGALHMQAQSVSRKVIAQTSHWPQMDRPEVFNGILDVFLAAAR